MLNPTAIPLKAIHKIQSEDPVLNRVQDQILEVLNSFMRQVSERLGATPQFDTASLPAASASLDGVIVRVKDRQQAEMLQVCLSDANGKFSWGSLGASQRSSSWAQLGVWVSTIAPTTPVTYAQWLAGANGYWAWIQI